MNEDGFWCDLWVVQVVQSLTRGVIPAVLEPVALAVHFQDVEVMSEADQQRASEPFRAEDLGPQAKGRVEKMLETFQDWLVTELNLAAASTINEAGLVLRNFCWKCQRSAGVSRGTFRTWADSVPVVIVQQRRRAAGH